MPTGASVLILHGDTRFRSALNASFLRHGWRVKVAGTLREALQAVNQQTFCVLLSEGRMRDGDVYDLFATLNASLPRTPVIVLAANAGTSDIVRYMRGGAFDVIGRDACFDLLQTSARQAMHACKNDISAGPGSTTTGLFSPDTSFLRAGAMTLSELTRKHLEDTLQQAEGNRTNAAKLLGISVRTVRNKIRQYGLPPRSYA